MAQLFLPGTFLIRVVIVLIMALSVTTSPERRVGREREGKGREGGDATNSIRFQDREGFIIRGVLREQVSGPPFSFSMGHLLLHFRFSFFLGGFGSQSQGRSCNCMTMGIMVGNEGGCARLVSFFKLQRTHVILQPACVRALAGRREGDPWARCF